MGRASKLKVASRKASTSDIGRLKVAIRGAVQGVGFRPFVYRLAAEMGFCGWVVNSPQGVFIEAEGDKISLPSFLERLKNERPPRSFIQSLESVYLDPVGYEAFEVRESDDSGEKTAVVLPDIATCPDCLAEILNPYNRRYRYPFTNCTNCGPRFSIIERLPYDRANTTMKKFTMCDQCAGEYGDPTNRRFHAQPNACPICGPQLTLWDSKGQAIDRGDTALLEACSAIRDGRIMAVKGLGGFHLMADARNDEAIKRLRYLKSREEKPFAMMFPSLEQIKKYCEVDSVEEGLLASPESPIVLIMRSERGDIAESVAPGNPYWGIMLPYTPLHHLMMKELGFPIVATSGNRSEEPICTDENDALDRLGGIADLFLIHDRPIARHVDDSILRIMAGRGLVIRRARGFAPLPIFVKEKSPSVLAVGAHLKNTIAVAFENQIVASQHIGDLETPQAYEAFERAIADLSGVFEFEPEKIACDLHPDYLSTKYAQRLGRPLLKVQHHYAHILACMAENELAPPVFGISWDGTGYGTDNTVWGGEFLRVADKGFERFAHLRAFRLPGGEKAITEPRRAAIGLLYEIFGDSVFGMRKLAPLPSFSESDISTFKKMLHSEINCPVTSSAGRLFDAVSSIAGLRQITRFEGQAAMELEFALQGIMSDETYPFEIQVVNGERIVNWEMMIRGIIEDAELLGTKQISVKFHNTLAEIMAEAANLAGEEKVALSGGCFQNRYLTERAITRLKSRGFKPYWHQRFPPNDGGIALGQIMAAAQVSRREG